MVNGNVADILDGSIQSGPDDQESGSGLSASLGSAPKR